MSARRRASGLGLAAVIAPIAQAAFVACAPPEVACDELARALTECDLASESARCGIATDARTAEAFARMETEGCAALRAPETREMDPEVCDAFGWACPSDLFAEPEPVATRHAVLFVSGIDGRPTFDWSPRVLDAVRERTGSRVHHVSLSSWTTTEVRSRELLDAIERRIEEGEERVNLVCYAVAGIDCRYVASPHGLLADEPARYEALRSRIAAITTISTPHRGTDVARAALAFADGDPTGWVNAFVGSLEGGDHGPRAALEALSNESMSAWNARVTDGEGIDYESWAGVSHAAGLPAAPVEVAVRQHCVGADGRVAYPRHEGTRDAMSELLLGTAPFAARTLTATGAPVASPHDGMVSVDSAKWGTFRGCVPADHYDVIGQLADEGPDPKTGFDATSFYVSVLSDLARRGL